MTYRQFSDAALAFGVVAFLVGYYFVPESIIRDLFYIFIVAVVVFNIPRLSREWSCYRHPILFSGLALSAYLSLSALWGPDSYSSSLLYFAKQTVYIGAWLIACGWVALTRPGLFNAIPKIIVFVGVGSLTAAIASLFYTTHLQFPRMPGIVAGKNALTAAQLYGNFGVMAYALGRIKYPGKLLNLYLFIALYALAGIVLTQSRGPFVFTLVTLAAAAVIYRSAVRHLAIKIVLLMAIITLLLAGFPHLLDSIEAKGLSSSHRFEIWSTMFHRFLASPIWGNGVTRHPEVTLADGFVAPHSHNSWLDMMRYGGVIALFLALWQLVACFASWSRNMGYTPVYLWLLLGCLCALTNGRSFLSIPGWIWIYYWMPVGLIYGHEISHNGTEPTVDPSMNAGASNSSG